MSLRNNGYFNGRLAKVVDMKKYVYALVIESGATDCADPMIAFGRTADRLRHEDIGGLIEGQCQYSQNSYTDQNGNQRIGRLNTIMNSYLCLESKAEREARHQRQAQRA